MSNNLRTRNGMPFNFVNGLKVRGMDIESLIPGIEGIPEAGSKYQFAGNGSNKAFTLPVSPYNKDAVDVYVKQLYVHPDDYTLVGDTITLTEAPPALVAGETYNVVIKVNLTTLNGYVNASRVSFEGENLDDILEKGKPLANYSNLRAYAGAATQVRITDPGIAGFFYYDATDTTSTDNGGTVIVSGNGRRWKRSYIEAANVKWFGAVGNGMRNDTQEIQNAINSCTTLYIPEGNYIISGLTINKNNFKLYGEGESRTFLTMDNTSAIALALGSSTYVSGVDIRNIRIEGNLNNLGCISLGTTLNYAGRIKLYDLYIRGFMNMEASSGYAIRLNSNQNTDIYNVFTNDCHYGVYRANGGYCTSTKISGKNSYFGRNQTHGIYIDGQCDDVEISDAVIEGCLGAGIYVTTNALTTAGAGRGTRILINGAYFEENNKNGLSECNSIVIKGSATGAAQHTLQLERCQFAGNPSAPVDLKNIYLDRVYAYIGRNRLIPSDVQTTATCYVRFDSNRFPNGNNYASSYRALLGDISVTDFTPWATGADLSQINYVNSLTFPANNRNVSDPNTLDDYEEGTWTPDVTTDGTQPVVANWIERVGTYTKIGNLVFLRCVMRLTWSSPGNGTPIITGLPFVPKGNEPATFGIRSILSGPPTGSTTLTSGPSLRIDGVTFAGVSGYLNFSITYQVA